MAMPPQDKPTSWTPTTEPISVDKLGRQPPPEQTIIMLPLSRFVRAWVQSCKDVTGSVTYEMAFEVDTSGEPYVYKHEARKYTLDSAMRELAVWVGGYRFGVE